MFAVVGDVEHYPEFLPWCAGLTVKSRTKEVGIYRPRHRWTFSPTIKYKT